MLASVGGVAIFRIGSAWSPRMRTLSVACVVYVAALLAVTLLPFPVTRDAISIGREYSRLGIGPSNNLTLFGTIRNTWGRNFEKQVLGNVLLFLPLGIFLGLLGSRARLATQVSLLVGSALAIETTQLVLSRALGYVYKSFDVDDLWLNSLGGLVGLGLGRAALRHPRFTRRRER